MQGELRGSGAATGKESTRRISHPKCVGQLLVETFDGCESKRGILSVMGLEAELLRHDIKAGHERDVEVVLMGVIRPKRADFGVDGVGSLFDEGNFLIGCPNGKLPSEYMYVNRALFQLPVNAVSAKSIAKTLETKINFLQEVVDLGFQGLPVAIVDHQLADPGGLRAGGRGKKRLLFASQRLFQLLDPRTKFVTLLSQIPHADR